MKAIILAIGDELLIGQTLNTNSHYISTILTAIGIEIVEHRSIKDDRHSITEALHHAGKNAELVLITGGLGPTKDDITKKVVVDYFDTSLLYYPEVSQHIQKLFADMGKVMPAINEEQAHLPAAATILMNAVGTAMGMLLQKENTTYVFTPGIPSETQHLYTTKIIPYLKSNFSLPFIYHHTVLLQGISESSLAEKIAVWEDSLATGYTLAYLPNYGIQKLRISATGNPATILPYVHSKVSELYTFVGNYILAEEDIPLATIVRNLLQKNKKTLAVVETITGGKITSLLLEQETDYDFFRGGIIANNNAIKTNLLGVPSDILDTYSPVSEEATKELAIRGKKLLQSDYCMAISGTTNPADTTQKDTLGLTYIAIATPSGVVCQGFTFGKQRSKNIHFATYAALACFIKQLKMEEEEV